MLQLDDDVIAAARELAASERRSLGAVISELARRGLTPARVDTSDGLPVIRVPAGTPAITPEMAFDSGLVALAGPTADSDVELLTVL